MRVAKNIWRIINSIDSIWRENVNLLLTEREGRTGEYWPEVVAIRTERSEVRTKTTEGQYYPVRLELARLVRSLLYGTRAMLVLNLLAFENKKIHSLWPFPWKRWYGEIPTKKEPIRTLGFNSKLPCHIILPLTLLAFMSSSSAVKHSSSFFFNSFFRCWTSRKASSLSRLIRWASSAFCLAKASNEASCDCCCIWKQQTYYLS